MFTLLQLIRQYAHIILFIFFESVSFYLIITYNKEQKDIFLYSSALFSGAISDKSSKISDYLTLKEDNVRLINENTVLVEELINEKRKSSSKSNGENEDSFDVIPATIINQTIHSSRNYLTLNVGSKQGITKSMGVINQDGIVGIVNDISENYCRVISLLNTKNQPKCQYRRKELFWYDSLAWNESFNSYLRRNSQTHKYCYWGKSHFKRILFNLPGRSFNRNCKWIQYRQKWRFLQCRRSAIK